MPRFIVTGQAFPLPGQRHEAVQGTAVEEVPVESLRD
jgi:hypothetical protein